MGKISIDLSSLKAAGIYTLEVDNTQRVSNTTNALRMIVGFCNKGPFNRPVLLEQDQDRISIYGDVDTKLERKGCFFNRMMRTLLSNGPVIALNLLNVDDTFDGPDQINYAALSLDAATENPRIQLTKEKHGEYDYLAESIDNIIYGTVKGDKIPYIGAAPFASVHNRTRFWIPDKELLMAAAARGLQTKDATEGHATYEYSNFLNFTNVGTDEFSVLVYKPANMNGYDVTAEAWYGGIDNIPFGWIRPYDFISDYFIQVVCVKGNWSNYPTYATDPIWGQYFDKKGIVKDKVMSFLGADGVTVLGSWSGIIIPDFTDKQGNNLSIEKKINSATERTGLLVSFNNDAANVLTYDYSGKDADESEPDQGSWGIDIDGNNEIEGEKGENTAPYIIDMVGHGVFMEKPEKERKWLELDLEDVTIPADSSIKAFSRDKKYLAKVDMVCVQTSGSDVSVLKPGATDYVDTSAGTFVNQTVMFPFNPSTDSSLFIDNNLMKYINPAYYVVNAAGAIQTSQISLDNVEFNYVVNPSTNVPVKAEVYYGDALCRVTFNVATDENSNIVNIKSSIGEITFEVIDERPSGENYYGINFMSYNYIATENDGVDIEISHVNYFNDPTLWLNTIPVGNDVKNMFIVTDNSQWLDASIKVGDYVRNITYNNEIGETVHYKLIPGLARIIKKQFYKVSSDEKGNYITYKGEKFYYIGEKMEAKNYDQGFYLLTASAPVLIENNKIHRQLPISDDKISHSLRFMPMKGLTLTSRHRPGYDEDGNLNMEEGIEKIYKVLYEDGIRRGLMNKQMVDYRYIIDSMSGGIAQELGGKVYLSKIAKDRGKCTAILNMPSSKQFAVSSNPYFCDSYIPGVQTRPSLNTKYIAEGGNTEMGTTAFFSLPSEDDGAKFTACFWPNLLYTENGVSYSVPPAADVANVLNRKFTGVNDPYCICANEMGIISNKYLSGVEFDADLYDREYLEPFGVNTIIKDGNSIMIYGNQTAYQTIKSDFNKLHIRENLNTVEIECEKITKRYNFLYNTPAVRANLVAQLTPILQAMVTSGAIDSYEIICDETNNTADVIEQDVCIVDVEIVFNHGMEKIVQQFTVNRKTTTATN